MTIHDRVDVETLKKKIIEKLAKDGFFNDLTGQLLGVITDEMKIVNCHFEDALHPEVHNDLLESTEKVVEWVLEAWNRDGSDFL